MDIDNIPKEKVDNFPMGVSEHWFSSKAEVDAFLQGFSLPQDTDCSNATPFVRDGKWVVRVRVGYWYDEK